MLTFRKLAAASAGKLLRAYFTENTPEPIHDPATTPGREADPGGRLTAYYTGRDSRATFLKRICAPLLWSQSTCRFRYLPETLNLKQVFILGEHAR